jgi:predicted nucleic acid-binding protein
LDASVAVKWFKKGEEGEEQALRIREDIFTASTVAVAPHLLLLEVVRALVKVGYPSGKIEEAYSTMKEASDLELIKLIPIQTLLDKAKEIEIELKLFASDATYLAAAITEHKNLHTDDSHLLKQNVREYAQKQGIHVLPVK